jgi:hypothetical protein
VGCVTITLPVPVAPLNVIELDESGAKVAARVSVPTLRNPAAMLMITLPLLKVDAGDV